jgi:hypothetical protein
VPVVRFARTLNRDIDAVRNAIELPWSNGQVGGQINRLETLKRAMYDRAGRELLLAKTPTFRDTDRGGVNFQSTGEVRDCRPKAEITGLTFHYGYSA